MLLRVENVSKRYHQKAVLRGVTFSVEAGETVGLIGQSGSGKSTLTRCILGLERPDAGAILVEGLPWQTGTRQQRAIRQTVQAVFQDSAESFNPRWTMADSVLEPTRQWNRLEATDEWSLLTNLCDVVQLPLGCMDMYPRDLSGGQKQRAAIARALSIDPHLVVLDEATTALDTVTQHHIVNLLQTYQRERATAFLIVSHDLSVIARLCDRILVLSEGIIIDAFHRDALFDGARHPYTVTLRDAFVEKGRFLHG